MEFTIRTPQAHFTIITGSEGPKHDPYSYQEYRFTRPGRSPVILHLGLAQWFKYNGTLVERPQGVSADEVEGALSDLFAAATGMSPTRLERALNKLYSRCPVCGSRDSIRKNGYPGETFTVCADCGAVLQLCSIPLAEF